ncbi:Cytochrome P450 [Penicillium cf. griseofulvum]|uniref:Cytochrome P450 n=1 Tax=Penicillium cf. griseofulvum TaxID=2972120 RepID=A0A9W9MB16_9EURO|nr:Cytochrome P450 [Penicillium cf. griseofulvum]KAJ5444951.1 Cytochrome P450 [Penicillium cf. griseofulvum]
MALETFIYLLLSSILAIVVHRLFLHPLRHVPGPFLASLSSLFLYVICYLGVEGRVLRYFHRRFRTPVLRVGPNSVSISDSSALRDIYIANGGFPKDDRYKNFDLGPIVSIFSSRDTEYRDRRAKAVAPLFAPARLRSACAQDQPIGHYITQFVERLRIYHAKKVSFDLVDICARLSIDVVTGYLLGEPYGGFAESAHLSAEAQQEVKLSANLFIFAIVAFSRFSLLPNFLFKQVYRLAIRLASTDESIASFHKLDQFAVGVTSRADIDSAQISTYQSRLLEAGVSPEETAAQCKAVIFAGADSTAVMLATILFHLIHNKKARRTLSAEVRQYRQESPSADPESIPYLRAVIKEGLRLGMANPTRLTRVIPSSSILRVGEHILPAGTVVGCAAYNLHYDEDVFPRPFDFRPERWLEGRQDGGLMERNMMPFGVGSRACIGKNLAMRQLYETVLAVVSPADGGCLLDGARMRQSKIDMIEWFNGEIRGHCLDVDWD